MAHHSDRPSRILVFDDLPSNLRLISRWLRADGFDVRTCNEPEHAVPAVLTQQPDAILMDVRMPRHDGFSICRELKREPVTRLIPVVLMTAANDPADRLEAIEAGADDFVTKPLHREEISARLRSLVRVKRFTDELDRADDVIMSLALTIEARDAYTDGHCQRLAAAAVTLGRALGLADDDLAALRRGGFMHDLGKIGVPDSILLKPGALTPSEYEAMKQHPSSATACAESCARFTGCAASSATITNGSMAAATPMAFVVARSRCSRRSSGSSMSTTR